MLFALLLSAAGVEAHRLDEYVEQTLVEIEPARVVLHLDLTAGVAVAPRVIAAIDTDGDGVISAAEEAAYAEAVRRDLSLSMNGEPLGLRVASAKYSPVEAMKAGTGVMALALEAQLPAGVTAGTLVLANHHEAAIGRWLMNCLMPRAPVQVLGQSRSRDQSTYEVEVRLGPTVAAPPARGWIPAAAGAVVLAGVLGFTALRRRSLAPR